MDIINKGSNKEPETKNNTPANSNVGNAASNGNSGNGNSDNNPGNSGSGNGTSGNVGDNPGNGNSNGGNSGDNSDNGGSNGGPRDNGNNGQGSGNQKIALVIVVNSEPVTIEANLHEPLQVVALHALQKTGNIGRDLADWRMKTEAGDVLDFKEKVLSFGFTAGTELFLSLKAGEGGC